MRIKLTKGSHEGWIAGDPELEPWEHLQTGDEVWLPTRVTGWSEEPGWQTAKPNDSGCPGFELNFTTARVFANIRALAVWLSAFRARGADAVHPWSGTATMVWDDGEGGSIELEAENCAVRLTKPVSREGLTLHFGYQLIGGLLGEAVVYPGTDVPDQYDQLFEYADYEV